MSSSTSVSSSAPSAIDTGNNGGIGNAAAPSNGQLPFSFLMAFIAVFLFFLGCGFGTRRLSIELHRSMTLAVGQCSDPPPRTPELWDVCPRKARQTMGKFRDFLPLSASYVREREKSSPAVGGRPPSAPPSARMPEMPRGLRVLEFVPFVSIFLAVRTLRRMRALQAAAAAGVPVLPPAVPPPPVRAVNVSVLIAMPTPHRAFSRQSHTSYAKDIADYAIPSLSYAASDGRREDASEESRSSCRSTGKGRESGWYSECMLEGDAVSGEYAIGIAQVRWDTGEVDF